MNETPDGREQPQSRLKRRRRRLLARLKNMWQHGFEDAETGGIGELSLYDQHPADLGAELNARQTDLGLQQNIERMLEQVEKALRRIETGGYGTCERCGRTIDRERLDAMPYVTLCITCQTEVDGSASSAHRRSDGRDCSRSGFDSGFRIASDNGTQTEGPVDRRFGIDETEAGDSGQHAPVELQPSPPEPLQTSEEYARHLPGEKERPVEELSLNPPFGRTFRDGDDYAAYDGEDAWQDVARFGTANTPQDVPPAVDYDDVYVDADEPRGIVSAADAIEDLSGQGVSIPEVYPEPEHDERSGRRRGGPGEPLRPTDD